LKTIGFSADRVIIYSRGDIMERFALAFLICLPALASSPWTPTQYVLEGAYQAALLCDWRQTSDFHKTWVPVWGNRIDYGVTEVNPMLGRHPSQARINEMCALSSIGHVVVSEVLPGEWRNIWQGVTMGLEIGFVAHNHFVCRASIKF
jgi:hypothetical protein